MHSIGVKFGTRSIRHRLTNSINFGIFRFIGFLVFFLGIQKRILLHYSQLSHIIRSILNQNGASEIQNVRQFCTKTQVCKKWSDNLL